MALLAEQLVDEWLNRNGFFTLRGIKSGFHEIDLLGVRMSNGEGWHVECQVSFRPVSYIGRLSKERQLELGAKSATSAKKRPQHVVEADIDDWVEKKFKTEKRKRCAIFVGKTSTGNTSLFMERSMRKPNSPVLKRTGLN
jgi:hypothetical protein